MSKRNKNISGRDNPSRQRRQDLPCHEEAPETIRARLVAQDDAFKAAMGAAPEARAQGVNEEPGTSDPRPMHVPTSAFIRSPAGDL